MHNRKLLYIKLLELIYSFFLFTYSLPCYTKIYTITENGFSLEYQIERIFSEIKSLAETEKITIQIRSGYYPISKPIEIKGWRHEIVFVGSKNNPPVISGSIEVTEWQVLPGGIWIGRVPDIVGRGNYFPDQLFVNGVRVSRSRVPEKGAFVLNDCFKKGTQFGAILSRDDIKLICPFGEDEMPILSVFRKWTVSKRYLSEVSQSNNTLYFSGLDFSPNNELEKGNKIVVENLKEYVDDPGEWCYDKKGYIYYFPKKGETIENTIIRIPVVETLVKIHSNTGDVLGINFDNIIFEHTSYQVPKEGCELGQAAAPMSAAIEVDKVNNIHFDNCEIRGLANYGIWLRRCCLKSSVKNCYFHDLGAGAIKIGSLEKGTQDSLTSLIAVENNIIHRYGMLMENAVGIILFNPDCS